MKPTRVGASLNSILNSFSMTPGPCNMIYSKQTLCTEGLPMTETDTPSPSTHPLAPTIKPVESPLLPLASLNQDKSWQPPRKLDKHGSQCELGSPIHEAGDHPIPPRWKESLCFDVRKHCLSEMADRADNNFARHRGSHRLSHRMGGKTPPFQAVLH